MDSGTPLLDCHRRDRQEEILAALKSNDIYSFRQMLNSNQVELEEPNQDTYLSIFDYACQTPGRHEFVAECIRNGCDVNKINENFQKTSINFAVESLDLANISQIVNQVHTNLDHKYEHNTPLNFLAAQLTDANYKPVFECIRLLVERQANPNIPNHRDITPIINILRNKEIDHDRKEAILSYLLASAHDLDLDNYRKGEARKLLTQQFPHLELPPIAEKLPWSFATLMRALVNGNESAFLRGLHELYTESLNENYKLDELFAEHENDETLLIAAARRNNLLAVERMIRLGANVNYKIRKNSSPIEVACQFGRWRVLELLLQTPNIELRTAEPLLLTVVKRVGDATSAICDYNKCFDLLIDHPATDIDRTDINGCSALHYAVQYSQQRLVLKLLERGAYIGVNNKFNHVAIYDINARTLETHLNACISSNGSRTGEDCYEVLFDYMNLVPDCYKPKSGGHPGRKLPSFKHELNEFKNEMTPINYIAQCKDLRHLLTHPLITSFIFLKWSRLSAVFYMNLIMFCIFEASLIAYILCCYLGEIVTDSMQMVLHATAWSLLVCLAVREALQFLMSPSNYVRSFGNYVELLLIGLVVTILSFRFENNVVERSLAAITILVSFYELFLLIGSLQWMNFSTHLVMLKTVSCTFLKSFMLYSLILIAFSLCFFTLLNEKSYQRPANATAIANATNASAADNVVAESPSDDEGDFNKFENVPMAVLKTVVMLTGEFEAASINFELNRSSYIIFLVFLFFMSTVLFNLLSGLAVSDTQEIRAQSELRDLIQRVEMMGRYESVALCHSDNYIRSYIKSWASSHISLFRGRLPMNKIAVQPNVGNRVALCEKDSPDTTYIDAADPEIGDRKALFNVSEKYQCWSNIAPMRKTIVKRALGIIQRNVEDQIEQDDQRELLDRIRSIEESIATIAEQLKILTHTHVHVQA